MVSNNKRKIIKPSVLNLADKNIDKYCTSLLHFGSNFVSTPKSSPYVEINTAIESQMVKFESGKMDTSAENLQQNLF